MKIRYYLFIIVICIFCGIGTIYNPVWAQGDTIDTTLIQDSNGIWYSNDVVSATILIIPVENSPEIPGD